MLYRASVYSILLDRDAPGEMLVFFECPPNGHAPSVLQDLVAAAWHLPAGAIEHYNLANEAELRRDWAQPLHLHHGVDRDTVLLQVGDGPDGAIYARPATTQLMVPPYWHQRLATAQDQVARLQRLQDGQRIFAQALARRTGGRVAATSSVPAAIAAPAPRNLLALQPGAAA